MGMAAQRGHFDVHAVEIGNLAFQNAFRQRVPADEPSEPSAGRLSYRRRQPIARLGLVIFVRGTPSGHVPPLDGRRRNGQLVRFRAEDFPPQRDSVNVPFVDPGRTALVGIRADDRNGCCKPRPPLRGCGTGSRTASRPGCPAGQQHFISGRADGLHIGPVFGVLVFLLLHSHLIAIAAAGGRNKKISIDIVC